MNPDLEPEKDNGFGVGKTPNFADDVSINKLTKKLAVNIIKRVIKYLKVAFYYYNALIAVIIYV